MSEKIIFGYWGVRGRGQPLRHLFMYCGLEFEERSYMTPDQYAKDMEQLSIPFPNLPYLVDGDVKITETLAIAWYIIKKSGKNHLLGNTPQQQAAINYFYHGFNGLLQPIISLFYNKKVDDLKIPVFYKAKQHFTKIEKLLSSRQFSNGPISYVDFFIAEASFFLEKLYPNEYDSFKGGINKIRQKIMALPEVQAYYKRQNAILTPFLPPQMSSIPFFWPGTEPKMPPPPPTSTKKSSEVQKSPAKTQPAQQQPPKQQQAPQEEKAVSSTPPTDKVSAPVEAPPKQEPKYFPPPAQSEFYSPANGPLKVAVISGSVSQNSPVNYFLGKLTAFGHPGFQFEWTDISSLEIHNQDIDEQGTENVNNLRGQIYGCDGVLIGLSATHNGLSSVLNNAYNWLTPVLAGKAVGLVSIQCSLAVENSFRETLKSQNIPFLEQIHYGVPTAQDFFDGQGEISEPNWDQVKGYFNCFAKFIEYTKQ